MKRSEIEKIIDKFPTKHKQGFTQSEVNELLTKLEVDREKYNEALGVYTCMLIDGESITYHSDVSLGIRCAIENRKPRTYEFD